MDSEISESNLLPAIPEMAGDCRNELVGGVEWSGLEGSG